MKNCFKISILALIVAVSMLFASCAFSVKSTIDTNHTESKNNNFTLFESTYTGTTNRSVSMESKIDSFTVSETNYGA